MWHQVSFPLFLFVVKPPIYFLWGFLSQWHFIFSSQFVIYWISFYRVRISLFLSVLFPTPVPFPTFLPSPSLPSPCPPEQKTKYSSWGLEMATVTVVICLWPNYINLITSSSAGCLIYLQAVAREKL